ncbi:MAG: hypothetical protein KBF59_08875 [Ignavibacterium sp.]|nr:hypothetical protein [Ignavibacterium sp.]
MKHLKFVLIIISISIMHNGCLRTYYPAVYHSSAPVMVSETNNNPEIYSNYLGLDYTIGQAGYENENIQMMKLNFLIANTQDHTNFNLEGFGYTGGYRVSGLSSNYDGDKTFIGLGTDLKFNVNFKFGKFKLGTGINLGLGMEFGEYFEFRKNAGNAHIIDDENSILFIMFSATPMLSYEFSESTILSAQINAGMPGGLSPSIVLNHNRFTYWITWLPDNDLFDNNYGVRLTLGVMIGLQDLHLNI